MKSFKGMFRWVCVVSTQCHGFGSVLCYKSNTLGQKHVNPPWNLEATAWNFSLLEGQHCHTVGRELQVSSACTPRRGVQKRQVLARLIECVKFGEVCAFGLLHPGSIVLMVKQVSLSLFKLKPTVDDHSGLLSSLRSKNTFIKENIYI